MSEVQGDRRDRRLEAPSRSTGSQLRVEAAEERRRQLVEGGTDNFLQLRRTSKATEGAKSDCF